eukprot:s462_g72.t1
MSEKLKELQQSCNSAFKASGLGSLKRQATKLKVDALKSLASELAVSVEGISLKEDFARLVCAKVVRDLSHHIVSAILHEDHWTPLRLVPHRDTLVVNLYGHDRRCEERVLALTQDLVALLGFSDWALRWSLPVVSENDLCGPLTIAFLGHIIVGAHLPISYRTLRDLHTQMRASFVAPVYNGFVCRCPSLWGFGFPRGE